jgi:protein TonB
MERAQREADGPKRRIIEAAKAREKASARPEAATPRAKAVTEAAPVAGAPQPLTTAVATAAPLGATPTPTPAAVVIALPVAFSPAPVAAPDGAFGTARSSTAPDASPNPTASLAPSQPVLALSTPTSIAAQRSAAAEDAYAQDLSRLVDGLKRYPTSREARTLRPQGTVQLWLEVDRSGQLLQAGLAASSGAPLLDGEALRSVRVGRYAPFPSGAFDGQASRRFLVAIEYRYDGG